MLQLNKLKPLVKKRKRVGRGGSRGGTSGKGHKGQKARSGGYVSPKFEGGQMPLYRRLPKRGFNNKDFKQIVEIVNVKQLNELFEDGAHVDKALLIEKGLIRLKKGVKGTVVLKVLGDGPLAKKLTVVADAFSQSALAAINNLGGKAQLTKEI
jgi:large subunit ribosomal protein L15